MRAAHDHQDDEDVHTQASNLYVGPLVLFSLPHPRMPSALIFLLHVSCEHASFFHPDDPTRPPSRSHTGRLHCWLHAQERREPLALLQGRIREGQCCHCIAGGFRDHRRAVIQNTSGTSTAERLQRGAEAAAEEERRRRRGACRCIHTCPKPSHYIGWSPMQPSRVCSQSRLSSAADIRCD